MYSRYNTQYHVIFFTLYYMITISPDHTVSIILMATKQHVIFCLVNNPLLEFVSVFFFLFQMYLTCINLVIL